MGNIYLIIYQIQLKKTNAIRNCYLSQIIDIYLHLNIKRYFQNKDLKLLQMK
jgi:hypothetical protein